MEGEGQRRGRERERGKRLGEKERGKHRGTRELSKVSPLFVALAFLLCFPFFAREKKKTRRVYLLP